MCLSVCVCVVYAIKIEESPIYGMLSYIKKAEAGVYGSIVTEKKEEEASPLRHRIEKKNRKCHQK